MNRLLIGLAIITGSAGAAHAQARSYQPFRLDSGLTGTYVNASGRGGFGGIVEPKVYVHDNIAVGGRIEGAVMFGGRISSDGDTKMSMGAVAAMLAKGEYLLGTSGARPFVGLGVGMYDIVSQSIETGPMTAGVDQKAGRYFGVAPQIGVDLGRMRLAATYNMILGADIEVRQMVGNVEETTTYSQSYLTIEMSFRFGGRKIRRPLPPPPPMMAPPPPPPPMAPPPPPAAPPGDTPPAPPPPAA